MNDSISQGMAPHRDSLTKKEYETSLQLKIRNLEDEIMQLKKRLMEKDYQIQELSDWESMKSETKDRDQERIVELTE